MNRKRSWAAWSMVLLLAASAQALDRGARRIERFDIQTEFPRSGSRLGAIVTHESELPDSDGEWALRASLGAGSTNPDRAASRTFWGGELGLSYYVAPLTTLSLTGGYTYQDQPVHRDDVWSANGYVRQRFLSASNPISPYLEARAGLRRLVTARDLHGNRETLNDLLYAGVVGLEIRMRHDFSIMIEAGGARTEPFSRHAERSKSALAAIGMQYYWR